MVPPSLMGLFVGVPIGPLPPVLMKSLMHPPQADYAMSLVKRADGCNPIWLC
jgi:hypothetical protein